MRKRSSDRTRLIKTNESSTIVEPTTIVEPPTTLHDEGKFLRILTELPGIAEEKIRIDLENQSTSVTILAADGVVQFKKVINIPFTVRFSKKRFSDGVLELTLEKTNNEPERGMEGTCP